MCALPPNAGDEADEPWGHVGLLNRERAANFFARWSSSIIEVGYLDNKNLDNLDIQKAFRVAKLQDFKEGRYENYSHFWVVLRSGEAG